MNGRGAWLKAVRARKLKYRLNRRPTAPGRILVAHYLEPRGLSISALARRLGVSRKHVSDIVNGRARVTPAVAVRLAEVLNTSPALWVNLQAEIDIHDAVLEHADRAKLRRSGRASALSAPSSK